MRILRLAALPGLAAFMLVALPTGCGGSCTTSTSGGNKPVPTADEGKGVVDPVADGVPAAGSTGAPKGGTSGGSGAAPPDVVTGSVVTGGALTGGPLTGGPLTGGPLTGGPLTGGPLTGGALTGGPLTGGEESTGGGPDIGALLKVVKRKRTKDKRALEVLAEAEEAGAEPKALAEAANARGQALYATPDRAKVFFEWAMDKDPKYALPAFNLAKQSAVLGELADAKKWLAETRERGGKKLLEQIEYDPQWEILKDDPDVRALLK